MIIYVLIILLILAILLLLYNIKNIYILLLILISIFIIGLLNIYTIKKGGLSLNNCILKDDLYECNIKNIYTRCYPTIYLKRIKLNKFKPHILENNIIKDSNDKNNIYRIQYICSNKKEYYTIYKKHKDKIKKAIETVPILNKFTNEVDDLASYTIDKIITNKEPIKEDFNDEELDDIKRFKNVFKKTIPMIDNEISNYDLMKHMVRLHIENQKQNPIKYGGIYGNLSYLSKKIILGLKATSILRESFNKAKKIRQKNMADKAFSLYNKPEYLIDFSFLDESFLNENEINIEKVVNYKLSYLLMFLVALILFIYSKSIIARAVDYIVTPIYKYFYKEIDEITILLDFYNNSKKDVLEKNKILYKYKVNGIDKLFEFDSSIYIQIIILLIINIYKKIKKINLLFVESKSNDSLLDIIHINKITEQNIIDFSKKINIEIKIILNKYNKYNIYIPVAININNITESFISKVKKNLINEGLLIFIINYYSIAKYYKSFAIINQMNPEEYKFKNKLEEHKIKELTSIALDNLVSDKYNINKIKKKNKTRPEIRKYIQEKYNMLISNFKKPVYKIDNTQKISKDIFQNKK